MSYQASPPAKLGSKAGTEKCCQCHKTVYYAERKDHEGELFHITCFNKWWKEKTTTGEGLWGGKYAAGADVQPAYYRADDGVDGSKMESGAEYKGDLSPRSQAAQAAGTPLPQRPPSPSLSLLLF